MMKYVKLGKYSLILLGPEVLVIDIVLRSG